MTVSFLLGPASSTGSAMATMPWPTDWTRAYDFFGGEHSTSASTYHDVFGRKRTWVMRYSNIAKVDRGTLNIEWNRDGLLDMSPPDLVDTTYYKVFASGPLAERVIPVGTAGSYRYDVTLTLKEA